MSEQGYRFDEDEAVKFIRSSMSDDVQNKYEDDDILCIVDIIWDYYEKKGFLSLNIDDGEEEVLDVDDLIKYVKKEVKKDPELNIEPKDVEQMVKAELNYEESLEDFI